MRTSTTSHFPSKKQRCKKKGQQSYWKKAISTNIRPPAAACSLSLQYLPCCSFSLYWFTSVQRDRERQIQLTAAKVIQVHSSAQVNNPSQVRPPLSTRSGDQKPGREISLVYISQPYKWKMEHFCSLAAYTGGRAPTSLPKALHLSPSLSFPHCHVLPCSTASPDKKNKWALLPRVATWNGIKMSRKELTAGHHLQWW